ncbi:MAG TPA: hypothetical protein VLR49_02130 [Ferruginibacter sp.]|nr:hypothetical protein [Ferruginibacter sp.]
MKGFLITIVFFCIAIVAYSQSTYPLPKGLQGYKGNFSSPLTSKQYLLNPATGNSSKITPAVSIPCYRPDMSLVCIIPTLKLWVLPASIPNPFMKEED